MLTNKVQLINTVDACKALVYAAKLPLQVQGMLFGVNMFNVQNKSEKRVNLYLTLSCGKTKLHNVINGESSGKCIGHFLKQKILREKQRIV